MAKKKRKRARSAKTSHAKKHRTRKKRAASPKRSHARRSFKRSAPKRTHARRRARRSGFAAKPRKHHRRKSRRNPGGPYGEAAIGAGVGLAAYLFVQAVGYFITPDMVKDGQRNRGLIGGALAAGGLALAKKMPAVGLGLMAGSLLGAFGGWLTVKLFQVLPAKKAPTTSAVFADEMSAVFADPMSAVYSDNMRGLLPPMSGYEQLGDYQQVGDYQQLGDLVPQAPWKVPSPFY